MNEFTKEELKELFIMTIHIKRDYPGKEKTANDIKLKLQSLIDNYCESKQEINIDKSIKEEGIDTPLSMERIDDWTKNFLTEFHKIIYKMIRDASKDNKYEITYRKLARIKKNCAYFLLDKVKI